MRPTFLQPLFAELSSLKGIGPRMNTLFTRLLDRPGEIKDPRKIDLLWHFPSGVIDRSNRPKIKDLKPGELATFDAVTIAHKGPKSRGGRGQKSRFSKAPVRVRVEDSTGELDLVFFRADASYIERQLPIGELRYISGRPELYANNLQIPHPDHVMTSEEFENFPKLEPVYPMTQGLTGRVLQKAMSQITPSIPDLTEWQEKHWLAKQNWPDFKTALTQIHRPDKLEDMSASSPARQRLAYDELLAKQLSLALVRRQLRSKKGRSLKGNGRLRDKIIKNLPFTLTGSQQSALAEIYSDMASDNRMLRLLQGDVGSGKTVVALLTAAVAIEAGHQVALMAPTEVLARQHIETLEPLCAAAGIRLGLLTGREKGRARKQLLLALEEGLIDCLVGTHALFQSDVIFKDLAFAIIDEQHRFGVEQRLALQAKAGPMGAELLVMTATPIPRTLQMTHYGDMDVSKLTEKPAGRKPVNSRVIPITRLEEVIEGVRRAIQQGTQVYWVCPLVESSDKVELAAAEERHAHLTQLFGNKIGLVHGQMKGPEKDSVMARFSSGELPILVATTVIEVGVNVPNASIMVIEHSERFGLSQLHQLRGRVGRGEKQSSCIFLYTPPLGATAKARLEIMRETEDGFIIAEEDLKLRGGGEMLGRRQSGDRAFRVANVPNLEELIAAANDDVKLILNEDSELKSPRGQALRTLVYLFECDEAIKLFRAG
ncbi:MAG: ATP-dependent DNA helicase RecG [Rhodomicrobium sp.]|nr:MAG: ATP-dependent DNA helicase RecG [Rhodomicrobium sp.]